MVISQIKLLLLTALAACLYLFITDIKRGRRTERLIEWVKTNYPAHWDALQWTTRKINRLGGMTYLQKKQIIADPHFVTEFQAIKLFRRDQIIAFGLAISAIGLVFLGVTFWGWQ